MADVDQRSAADIQREIEDERSALTRTLDEIHDRLSFEALSSDLVERVRDQGGEIGRSVMRSARDNPIPLALTAVGIAWLIASRRNAARDADPYARTAATPASARGEPEWEPGRESGWESGRLRRDPGLDDRETSPLYDAAGRPIPHRVHPRWDTARGAYSGSAAASEEYAGDRQDKDDAAPAPGAVRSGLYAAGHAAQSAAAGVGRRLSGAARRAQGAYASAGELRERITHGTEDLSRQARERVVAARTRAYEAQLRAEHYAVRGRDKASDLLESQPLVAGALALAVGAALGGLLPRTTREDGIFGAYRDQAFEEAERIYRDERARFETVAREAAREARDVARDVAGDVRGELEAGAERAADIARTKLADVETEAKDAAARVADKAKAEAERQKVGRA